VSIYRRDLLKQGAHVLGVACRERPTHVVGQKLGVANDSHALTPHQVALIPNGVQGDGGVIENWQVAHDVVLGLHLADVLLQAGAQVSAHCCDLLKQGAHMLGVACRERPTRVVGQKLGVTNGGHASTPHRVALVPNGEQGHGGVIENQQLALA
jgi:hypothetical protein